jgi:hypothetical protein
MIQGVSTSYRENTGQVAFMPPPVRSLPLIPETYRLTASPAGTLITIGEVEIQIPPPAVNPSAQEAAVFRLEILI